MFPLEHFYYGQLVHRGKPQTELRLLAKSSHITDAQVAEAVRFASATPSDTLPQGTWALVRGRRTPFFIVQAQRGSNGNLITHYIIVPSDVLRAMVGNVTALATLLQDTLPTYDRIGDELVPLTLTNPTENTAEQVDVLLDLMTYSQNKMRTIEVLLGAIVKGMPLVVINAPTEIRPRIRFIQGLLTLLPSSTRYGVTFATSSDSNTQMSLQIRFMDGGKAPGGSIVYDWTSGDVLGDVQNDDYSRFIISQFRLDTELVIQQTETLTPIAGWRFRNGDSLAAALAYASYRTKVDKAVMNNQPVEVSDVSKVLSDDPTLTPELRVAYSRHLINLSLAIEDMQFAEPVAVMLHNNKELSRDIHKQMTEALNDGAAYLIYETLLGWMGHPLGPQGQEWIDLTYKAALAYLDELVEDNDIEAIHDYIDSIQSASTGVAIGRVVPEVVDRLIELVASDPALAMPLLSLSVQHVPKEKLAKILNDPVLRVHMPQTLLNFLSHLFNQQMPPAPSGTLMGAVEALSPKTQKHALLKFTEMVELSQRLDLVDAEVLHELFKSTQTNQPIDHAGFLLDVVKNMTEKGVKHLQVPGPRYLLQILYALHQYDLLARDMITLSRDYYGIDRQFDYVEMVQKLFASVKISANEATTALVAIRRNGIKGLPYLTASIGILEGTGWSSSLEQIADEAVIALEDNPRYLEVIQTATILAVLEYYARQKNEQKMIQVAQFVPTVAANRGEDGPPTMRRMLKLMSRERRARAMSFEFVRNFIRKAENGVARKSVKYFGREISKEAGRKLEVAYVISRFLGGVDLVTYTDLLEIAVSFLQDTAEAYHNNRPSTGDLVHSLDSIRVGFDVDDKEMLGKMIVEMAKAMVTLHDQRKASGSKRVTGLLSAGEPPMSILDIFRVMSGVVGKQNRFDLKMDSFRGENPFRDRTGPQILDHIDITNNILRAPMSVMPPGKPIKYRPSEIADEIESQMNLLQAHEQEAVRLSLPPNLQYLADLVEYIVENGDVRALEPGSSLASRLDENQRPKSTLEMYRFVMGYYT